MKNLFKTMMVTMMLLSCTKPEPKEPKQDDKKCHNCDYKEKVEFKFNDDPRERNYNHKPPNTKLTPNAPEKNEKINNTFQDD